MTKKEEKLLEKLEDNIDALEQMEADVKDILDEIDANRDVLQDIIKFVEEGKND